MNIDPGVLQLVEVVVQLRDALLQALALSRLSYNLVGLGSFVHGVTGHNLPVIKHTLGEGLASCV